MACQNIFSPSEKEGPLCLCIVELFVPAVGLFLLLAVLFVSTERIVVLVPGIVAGVENAVG